ncbi:helix-turn-helix domain-containing protein [Jeotgalibaca sp. MA1X17-3]|uniref:XRE family transcriptional regulator n=1 Tax=Jeotgalibaca sp. MA1X17-3 TaxID=2908211 RepID=UPI001F18CEF2|nr:S24 family peptidase [Jeotgalibaca sp. MA1X17-3]UJF15099.1 helix-turn-helix domain-containing protein [Jeotgalibaca sp. MA1X17-3]
MFDLRSRRIELGLTLEEVGNQVGVGKSTVRKWEQGLIDNMKRDKIALLANALKVSPLELILDNYSDEKNNITTLYNQLTQPRQKKVYNFTEGQLKEQKKIYNLGSSAAGPALAYSDDFVEEEKLERIPPKADFILTIQGDSMEPNIPNGSKVFVQAASMVENGEIAIVEIDGDGVTCKKVKYDYDNQKVILQSFNEDYKDLIYDSGAVKIIGRVVR